MVLWQNTNCFTGTEVNILEGSDGAEGELIELSVKPPICSVVVREAGQQHKANRRLEGWFRGAAVFECSVENTEDNLWRAGQYSMFLFSPPPAALKVTCRPPLTTSQRVVERAAAAPTGPVEVRLVAMGAVGAHHHPIMEEVATASLQATTPPLHRPSTVKVSEGGTFV